MGIFDELQPAKHTFGAWCRAKGVKLERVQEAVAAGRVSETIVGDGPEMSEEEFDTAIGLELRNPLTDAVGERNP